MRHKFNIINKKKKKKLNTKNLKKNIIFICSILK